MLRMGGPADVAGACLFLGSDLAAFISGAALSVHGGGEAPAFLSVVQAALAEHASKQEPNLGNGAS